MADPAVRLQLIEAAARLLAEEGVAGLTTRRLAGEVGVSTMAVYTHFGGMDEVRQAVRREGFTRLAARMARVQPTSDPIADISALGAGYFATAMADPHLYRVMFVDPVPGTEEDEALAASTLEPLIDAVRRAMAGGRLRSGNPEDLARQMWALNHGVVALLHSGLLDLGTATATLLEAGRNLLVASGANPAAVTRSLNKARGRVLAQARVETLDPSGGR